ncbi:hypothetical protein A3B45_01780 [Candidatus Daviesbacteria bacterium RIFCSPLOWO2_01_FULL_39_12]|uniref:Nudix hydrolase domain-containing protein n=1 Tax=Candidatus Daviesbacteria bacterium RIFCSPLOWO2_01_FULL_39_12 TaxID=1797785 RepID=A0A1F5KM62_9BACT|nr:MAG: hypothetical protein A3D79_03190 [Candidatus Daviesbacteria bacterium RIFCSPHIGHO2_02_FULL_39_8]OGE41920.1 MAG: hypothetical protein A3B45_01780 [Candidatus Daviesbacteria bacterium RIFCSPLOWO2_01_FULL_39_12]HLC97043.1 NUDIX domain-containing protein [Candidatus Nanoarchaeia archaeon]
MAGKKRPKVGIGVLVLKDGKALLAKRKGAHGKGEYAFPGGHLEFGESILDCVKRECWEEAGIKIKNIKFVRISNLKKYTGKHYVDIGLIAQWMSGEPQVLEPHKTEEWNWYDFKNLPQPLFEVEYHTFEALKTGKNFFDN